MIKLKIPFYPNLKDDLHCFQASLKMALSVLAPSTQYSYATLDSITGHKRGRVTWDIKTLLWLAEHGFYVKKVSILDYRAFAKLGASHTYNSHPVFYPFHHLSPLIKAVKATNFPLYREMNSGDRLTKQLFF